MRAEKSFLLFLHLSVALGTLHCSSLGTGLGITWHREHELGIPEGHRRHSSFISLLLKCYNLLKGNYHTETPEQRPRLISHHKTQNSQLSYSVTRTPPSIFRLASIACNSRTFFAISMGVAAAKRAFKGGAILNVRLILE